MNNSAESITPQDSPDPNRTNAEQKFYRIRFRKGEQIHFSVSKILDLQDGELVMTQTDHGLEPASIAGHGNSFQELDSKASQASYNIVRRANREEIDKYANLILREQEAFCSCQAKIEELGLLMKLVRVERFFNGSNIIFYFTADNRVDFRALVKDLVQEFRTRVEMRQIGVRHETQMIGGIGCCGRELCCSSFMKKFVPVSIKMVKEQDLPLNPTKISGVCNRLLCCLTHEFDTYKSLKKGMPKPGKIIEYEGRQYKVSQCNTLQETVKVVSLDVPEETKVLSRDEWRQVKVISKSPRKKETPPPKKNDRPPEAGHVPTKKVDKPAPKSPAKSVKSAKASAKGSGRPKTKKSRPSRKVKKK